MRISKKLLQAYRLMILIYLRRLKSGAPRFLLQETKRSMTVMVKQVPLVRVEVIVIVTVTVVEVEVIVGVKAEVLQVAVGAAATVIVMLHQAARKDLMHLWTLQAMITKQIHQGEK
jgi:hypothetical protein